MNHGRRDSTWTLLTGHGHVLVEIARDPQTRIRDIAAAADITERTAQAIVSDLEAACYITRTGRRARYTVNRDSLFRHPAQKLHDYTRHPADSEYSSPGEWLRQKGGFIRRRRNYESAMHSSRTRRAGPGR